MGSAPGKKRSASVWLTITTRVAPARSVALNSRPRRNGIPAARKYSGLAVRSSACGVASPAASGWNSPLMSKSSIELRSGIVEPSPTSTTPGRARISRCMRAYSALLATSNSRLTLAGLRSGTGIVSTSSVRSPVLTSASCMVVRVSSPAPASSTTETATCATTSARCRRSRPSVAFTRRTPAARSAMRAPSLGSTARRERMSATVTDSPNAKPSAAQSSRISLARGE
jgi:hypothetical protein